MNDPTAPAAVVGALRPPEPRNPGVLMPPPGTVATIMSGLSREVPVLRASYKMPKPPRTTVCGNEPGDQASPARGSNCHRSDRGSAKVTTPGTLRLASL